MSKVPALTALATFTMASGFPATLTNPVGSLSSSLMSVSYIRAMSKVPSLTALAIFTMAFGSPLTFTFPRL